jgi:hypothetical protein
MKRQSSELRIPGLTKGVCQAPEQILRVTDSPMARRL